MKKNYYRNEGKRIRFWMKTPKQLWDCLPKFITRELASDTPAAALRCQACGKRLRNLFGRAVQGMVARTILPELVNEICNEELNRHTPSPEIVEIRQIHSARWNQLRLSVFADTSRSNLRLLYRDYIANCLSYQNHLH